MMGEASVNSTGLLSNITSLLNNPLFSDIKFLFMSDTHPTETIYGHKLILALRSEYFACTFFNKKESSGEIKLPSSKRSSFFHLLKFLYTDNLQFYTFEEALELYELAVEYGVHELAGKCSNYILREKLTMENLFCRYECALSKNMPMLLKDCQNFVCSNTRFVFESVHFKNASIKVVEDIVKLDNLTVSTERDVISAILRWGSEELKRKKLYDEKYLRECINPFIKHLRFLTLSSEEFGNFIRNFDIFSGYESHRLTLKIHDSQLDIDIPESLCSINVKRVGMSVSSLNYPSFDSSANCLPLNSSPKKETLVPTTGFTLQKLSSNYVHSSYNDTSPKSATISTNSYQISTTPKSSLENTSKFLFRSHSVTSNTDSGINISNAPESSTAELDNKISFQIKKLAHTNGTSKSQNQKFCSSPNILSLGYFPPSIMPDSSCFRNYELPLIKCPPSLKTAFPKDMKTSVVFKMKTGNIRLYGIELMLKDSEKSEELAIDVDLSGFSKQPYSHLFKEKLKNNVLTITFGENLVLEVGNKGTLDISIDNLSLDRCYTCINDRGYELNNGLRFACEISLNSNQKNDDGFLFLISKLIYVPC